MTTLQEKNCKIDYTLMLSITLRIVVFYIQQLKKNEWINEWMNIKMKTIDLETLIS